MSDEQSNSGGIPVERDGFAGDRKNSRSGESSRSRKRGAGADFSGFADDLLELQQGVLHAGIELVSAGLDTATNVSRNTVDRAFARDLRNPGDLLRNVGKDADALARDVVDGTRDVPRRMSDAFYNTVRPAAQRRDRGERWRRAQGGQGSNEG